MARCLTSVSSECPYISIFLPLPSPLPPIHHPPIPTSFVSQRSWSNSRQSHFPPKKKYILLCDKRSCVPFLMACINIFLPIHSFISLLLYYSFNYVYIYIKRGKKFFFVVYLITDVRFSSPLIDRTYFTHPYWLRGLGSWRHHRVRFESYLLPHSFHVCFDCVHQFKKRYQNPNAGIHYSVQ